MGLSKGAEEGDGEEQEEGEGGGFNFPQNDLPTGHFLEM